MEVLYAENTDEALKEIFETGGINGGKDLKTDNSRCVHILRNRASDEMKLTGIMHGSICKLTGI